MSDIQAGTGSGFGSVAASSWRLAGFVVGGRSAVVMGTEQDARQRGVPAPLADPVPPVAAPPRPWDAADPAAGSRLGAARGILIGLALSALAWAGIAALVVLALR